MRLQVSFDGKIYLLNLRELTDLLERMDVMILKSKIMEYADVHNNIMFLPNRAIIRPYRGGVFFSVAMSSGVPKENNSALGCIHRALVALGKLPQWRVEENVAQSPIFGALDAVVVSITKTGK